ncbi:MAG TPA: hypothetical protein VMV79_01235 [Alphaproteobacteria bacterium]|nr:hypothetical protein [Alphaproteobacteria bacterium]
MTKLKTTILGVTAALAIAAAPMSPALARGWDHHGGWGRGGHGDWGHHGDWDHHDHDYGPGLIGGLVGATAALVTVPFALAADLAGPPAPVYAAPAPVYAYPTAYPAYAYPRRRVVVYNYPPPAYPAPAYYYGY